MAKKQTIDIVVKAQDQASRKLRNVGGATQRLTSILKKAALAGAAYFGGRMLIGAFTGAIKSAMEYQRQIAEVSTMLSGEGMKALETYRVGVKEMAIEYGQSTAVMSRGLYDILSAGIAAAGAMEVLEVATKAAIGGMTDTGVAADGLTTVLNAYQMSARHATHVSDVMFAIVKDGKITYSQLAENIGKIAPTAKVAGMSLEILGAAIATMVKVEKPERAMTALRAAMMHAAKEGEKLLDLVRRFEGKNLEDIVGAGIGKRAAVGVAILSNNMGVLNKEMERFKNVTGEAEIAYGKMADTFHRRMERLKVWWEAPGVVAEAMLRFAEKWAKGYEILTRTVFGDPAKKRAKRDAMEEMQRLRGAQPMEMRTEEPKEFAEQMKQLEERLVMARRIRDVLGQQMMEAEAAYDVKREAQREFEDRASGAIVLLHEEKADRDELNCAYREAYGIWHKLYDQVHRYRGEMESIAAKEREAAALEERRADEMVASLKRQEEQMGIMGRRASQIIQAMRTPTEQFQDESMELTRLWRSGLLSGEQFGRAWGTAAERLRIATTEAERKAAKEAERRKKEAEDQKSRQMEAMKTRAERIKEAVMTPAERFKREREELTKLMGAGLLDEESFGRALQAALKRAGKTTAEWPVTQQLAAYEARILTRGRVRDRNDPAMQQVRIQQNLAKSAEDQKGIQIEMRDLLRQIGAKGGLKLTLVDIGPS